MEKQFSELKPEEVELITIVTNGNGPWVEDLFYCIFTKDAYWKIPNSQGSAVIDWLKAFPDADIEQIIHACGSTEERHFLLWHKSGPPLLSPDAKDKLRSRLERFLATHFSATPEQIRALGDSLFKSYGEPRRAYHNLRHLQHCLWELDAIPATDIDRAVIELAVWYHDVVHEPRAKNNEEASAERLLADLGSFETGLSLERVASMIRGSDHGHRHDEADEEARYFLDIDLSILGRGAIEYLVYRQNVRREYPEVGPLAFRFHRKRLLTRLLGKEIYRTSWFRERYEAQARKNIEEELAEPLNRMLPPFSFWRRK